MSRQLSIIIGAIGVAVAVILNRRRIADAAKRRARAGAATDDVSLARKVETHIFRPHDAPKGAISVDVEAGVVYLRGVADDAWRERLGREARQVPGVVGVNNLLHAPGTPTPPAPPRAALLDREPPPAPPAPRSSPGPATTSSPGPDPTDERPSQLAGPDPEATPVSAVSPAATTVRETEDDLMAGLREPVPDDHVEREVEAQLAAGPLPADEVSVEVRDHIAQLEGTVPDPQAAMLIADEAAHVDGVQGLDNRLQPQREAAADEEAPAAPRDADAPRDAEAARDADEARREAGG